MAEAQTPHRAGDAAPTVGPPAARERKTEERGYGWMVFAGSMFLLVAAFNAIWGIAALANDDYFAVDELLFGDLSMWGVFHLCFAVAQVATAFLVYSRSAAGAYLGILMAGLSATVALFSIGAYPLWSVTIMVVDGLIIYGLSVHGFAEE